MVIGGLRVVIQNILRDSNNMSLASAIGLKPCGAAVNNTRIPPHLTSLELGLTQKASSIAN